MAGDKKCPFCKLDRSIDEAWKHFSLTSVQSAVIVQRKIVEKIGIEHTCDKHRIPVNMVATMRRLLPASELETVIGAR